MLCLLLEEPSTADPSPQKKTSDDFGRYVVVEVGNAALKSGPALMRSMNRKTCQGCCTCDNPITNFNGPVGTRSQVDEESSEDVLARTVLDL